MLYYSTENKIEFMNYLYTIVHCIYIQITTEFYFQTYKQLDMPRAGETIDEWTIEPGCYETKSVALKKPKKAKTPYMIWRSENYTKIKKNLGVQANTHTIANECRKQWKQLECTIKSHYDLKEY